MPALPAPTLAQANPLVGSSIQLIESLQDPTGAYPASPTFSAYQGYCWLRDGSFIADAMSAAGRFASAEAFFGWCAERRRGTVAATGAAESSLWAARLPDRPVLLFGSEGDGLPAELVERCESAVCIPMVGSVESLNLASAAAVLLYELVRRSV